MTVIGQTEMFLNFKTLRNTKVLRAIVCEKAGDEIVVDLDTLIKCSIIPMCFSLPMDPRERVSNVKVAADIPEKIVNIKERQGLLRTDILFAPISEEQFEDQHEKKLYANLRKKLIKMFWDVFKEDLTPEDCLDIQPVKIQMVPHHKSVTP